jgi:hypothetical protein
MMETLNNLYVWWVGVWVLGPERWLDWVQSYPIGGSDSAIYLAYAEFFAIISMALTIRIARKLGRFHVAWWFGGVLLCNVLVFMRATFPPPGPPLTPLDLLMLGFLLWAEWIAALGVKYRATLRRPTDWGALRRKLES